MKRPYLSLFVGIVICILFYSIMTASSPEKTIKNFGKAYNEMDIYKMIDCFDPAYAKGIKAGLNLIGSFTKVNPNDILDVVPLISEIAKKNSEEYKGYKSPLLRLDIIDVEKDGTEARVKTRIILQRGIYDEGATGTFHMIKENGKWYIKDIRED